MSRRVAHIGSKVRTNPPPPLRSPIFVFFCSLYERTLSCHHTTSLQLKQRNLVERDVDCERVHDSRAVGLRRRHDLDWGVINDGLILLLCPQPYGRCTKTVRSRWYQDFHPPPTIAERAVCHSCKVLQSTIKGMKESDMDGPVKLFSFGFSRGRSGNQPKPNPSSAGPSEQIRKPSSSKESTSSPLEEEQRSRSQSVTAPSSIPGFNIGRIGGRRFLCTMRSVSQKSGSRCWVVEHEANDQLELIYVSSCAEGRNCTMLQRRLDMAEQTELTWNIWPR